MKLLLQRHGNSKRQTERPSHLPTPRGDLHGQRGGGSTAENPGTEMKQQPGLSSW
jgi:hypothetical protein